MSTDYEIFVTKWCAVRPEWSLPLADLHSLSPETRYTVEVVTKELTKCPNLRWLSLWRHQLQDLTPLSCLTHLSVLDLGKNQITDLTPLSCLTNLKAIALLILVHLLT